MCGRRRDGSFRGAVARTKQFECGHVAVGGLGKGGGEESVRGTLHPRREVGLVLPVEVGRVEQLGRHTEGTFAPRHLLRGRDDARGRAPAAGARSKGESGKAKEISVIFFIRSLGRVQQQIGMNRQSRRRAERAVAAAGRAPPENSQPKANRSRKPSGNGDSRKPKPPTDCRQATTGRHPGRVCSPKQGQPEAGV